MSTAEIVRCPECSWSGGRDDLDDSHGIPACPTCGSNVRVDAT